MYFIVLKKKKAQSSELVMHFNIVLDQKKKKKGLEIAVLVRIVNEQNPIKAKLCTKCALRLDISSWNSVTPSTCREECLLAVISSQAVV